MKNLEDILHRRKARLYSALKSELTRSQIGLWIKPIEFESNSPDQISLVFESQFARQWVKARYLKSLKQAISKTVQSEETFTFRLTTRPLSSEEIAKSHARFIPWALLLSSDRLTKSTGQQKILHTNFTRFRTALIFALGDRRLDEFREHLLSYRAIEIHDAERISDFERIEREVNILTEVMNSKKKRLKLVSKDGRPLNLTSSGK